MKKRMIESVVMFLFGLVITVVSLVTYAGVGPIVLGALLTFSGLLFIVLTVLDTSKEEAALAAMEEIYNTKIDNLAATYDSQMVQARKIAKDLREVIDEKDAEIAQLKAAAVKKPRTTKKATAEQKTVIE